ncbi:hypothetical protein BBJ28_00000964 [Nothophytophthora sp. Chile5]|nr:hypothetical protein BBJ28_00000964 [Nothophytophthora sp. Chile5]
MLPETTEVAAPVAPLTPTDDGVTSHEANVGSDKEAPPAEDSAVLTATIESPPSDTTNTAALAAAAEEAEKLRKLNGNGMVKLIYEHYDELFPIEDGSTTQTNIDEVYCLSFVMPNCLVRLSRHPNPERFQREESGQFDSLVGEDPRGTYHDLEKDQVYYVVVEQASDQLRLDQEATKARWASEGNDQGQAGKNDGRGFESCSCIYGNPCVDEYGCRDWHSRFAVATKNGWKGF